MTETLLSAEDVAGLVAGLTADIDEAQDDWNDDAAAAYEAGERVDDWDPPEIVIPAPMARRIATTISTLAARVEEAERELGASRSQPSSTRDHSLATRDAEPSAANETAWLIEETWSEYVHYVHRDWDYLKWAAECRRDADRKRMGLPSRDRVPILTKSIEEAIRFPSEAAAEAWIASQPPWMRCTDQYQIREHMWPAIQQEPASPTGQGTLPETGNSGMNQDWKDRALTAEATLEKVAAERDEWKAKWEKLARIALSADTGEHR